MPTYLEFDKPVCKTDAFQREFSVKYFFLWFQHHFFYVLLFIHQIYLNFRAIQKAKKKLIKLLKRDPSNEALFKRRATALEIEIGINLFVGVAHMYNEISLQRLNLISGISHRKDIEKKAGGKCRPNDSARIFEYKKVLQYVYYVEDTKIRHFALMKSEWLENCQWKWHWIERIIRIQCFGTLYIDIMTKCHQINCKHMPKQLPTIRSILASPNAWHGGQFDIIVLLPRHTWASSD